jgi:geranylgeranyl reductase family protein
LFTIKSTYITGADQIDEFDVIIIGGSLAGGLTGKLIAENGFNVLILEEHYDIGRPVQCAGLVTTRVLEYLNSDKVVLNTIKGTNIYSPRGNKLVIDNLHQKTVVLDRPGLDRSLIKGALEAGCSLKLGAKAISAKRDNNNGSIKIDYTENGKIKSGQCKLLIGADGVQSNVAGWFGLPRPEIILSGYGAEVIGAEMESDMVTILTGKDLAPNFFAWIIPIKNVNNKGNIYARVGLCTHDSQKTAFEYFNDLFTKHPTSMKILKNAQPLQTVAGAIPLGALAKTYCDNVMIVGDAAAQVKPTSGGGIYTSLVCAKYCASTAVDALDLNEYSEVTLSQYQKSWQNELGKDFKRGLMLHRAFTHLTDDQLEEGLRILNDEKLIELISKHGDIDYPWKLAKIVFRKVPAMLKFAKPFIKALI